MTRFCLFEIWQTFFCLRNRHELNQDEKAHTVWMLFSLSFIQDSCSCSQEVQFNYTSCRRNSFHPFMLVWLCLDNADGHDIYILQSDLFCCLTALRHKHSCWSNKTPFLTTQFEAMNRHDKALYWLNRKRSKNAIASRRLQHWPQTDANRLRNEIKLQKSSVASLINSTHDRMIFWFKVFKSIFY